ncbi:glycosyltransferase family 2 protein [Simkania negevensis]|uniref:Glycosyltransferase family 2 protein n=1 Tax=Simkania negevensis TaxID=83561 RepID=A0ABS3ARH2_9BACT|nr:glycosyltransferase family 2 protein [Simkania negevensis]
MDSIHVVIPMAGTGSRFAKAGYPKPKPFIDVMGKPMIIRVIENLQCKGASFILLAREEQLEQEKETVKFICDHYPATFVSVPSLTEGTACTVLLAEEMIDNATPLLIANSDQIVDSTMDKMIDDAKQRYLDGSILTFIDALRDPKWSFAKVNEQGFVTEVKEKAAISQYATVGIYYFAKGQDFVRNAQAMIAANERVNNEFYTCPVYNYLIKEGGQVGIYNIDQEQMHGLGTPEDLNAYLKQMAQAAGS